MFDEKSAQAIVDKYKEEDIIDGVLEVLTLAQQLLNPQEIHEGNVAFCAGLAVQEVTHAAKVLRVFRQKKYGQKPTTVL